MTYLIDTHALLWILNTPEKLPARVQNICQSRSAVLLISIATPWEMAIKTSLGKLDAGGILDDFDAAVARGHFTVATATVRQVIRAGLLPRYHDDPFNRLLAAQALDLDIPILSRDPIFDRYGVRRIWT